jgi:hypothetical protein
VTQDDQRPDLDAALDAVIPSITAMSDEAVTASLRRTRIALAEQGASAGSHGWRWAMPAAAAVAVAIVAAVVFWPRMPVSEAPRGAVKTLAPAPGPLPATPPRVAPFASAPKRVPPARLARAPQVAATSAPKPDEAPRPDPLIALVRAVQAIPEDAWRRGTSAADAPVTIDPIVVAPLETPPLPDLSPEPVAPGEP